MASVARPVVSLGALLLSFGRGAAPLNLREAGVGVALRVWLQEREAERQKAKDERESARLERDKEKEASKALKEQQRQVPPQP